MNHYQELWWQQAMSDHAVLVLLRRQGVAQCHQLHYLQMVTEKISKAYFWRSGMPPSTSHAAFVQLLRRLGSARGPERRRLGNVFAFGRFTDFRNWIRAVLPLAYALERLAPSLAQENSPNPEYPWPRAAPEFAPATFDFDVWKQLSGTGQGRQLLRIIDAAVEQFPVYA